MVKIEVMTDDGQTAKAEGEALVTFAFSNIKPDETNKKPIKVDTVFYGAGCLKSDVFPAATRALLELADHNCKLKHDKALIFDRLLDEFKMVVKKCLSRDFEVHVNKSGGD